MDIAWNKETIEGLLKQVAGDPDDPKERKKQRILASARELFTEQGYRKTSVDEIARHAHVAKGTVYLYFKSKPEILLGVISVAKLEMLEQFLPLFDESRPVLVRFEEYIRDALLVAAKTPLLTRMLMGDRELLFALQEAQAEMMGAGSENMGAEFLKAFFKPIQEELKWSDEVFDVKARTIVAVMRSLPTFLEDRAREGLDIETFASSFAELLTHGLLGGKT
jgi:AcrR family transcriptional regulator